MTRKIFGRMKNELRNLQLYIMRCLDFCSSLSIVTVTKYRASYYSGNSVNLYSKMPFSNLGPGTSSLRYFACFPSQSDNIPGYYIKQSMTCSLKILSKLSFINYFTLTIYVASEWQVSIMNHKETKISNEFTDVTMGCACG
jgi:hypothetical protein